MGSRQRMDLHFRACVIKSTTVDKPPRWRSTRGLKDRNIGVRFPARARDSFLLPSAQIGSEAHPAAYSLGARDKTAGVWICRVCGVRVLRSCAVTDRRPSHVYQTTWRNAALKLTWATSSLPTHQPLSAWLAVYLWRELLFTDWTAHSVIIYSW